jgi:hypothetical protein
VNFARRIARRAVYCQPSAQALGTYLLKDSGPSQRRGRTADGTRLRT